MMNRSVFIALICLMWTFSAAWGALVRKDVVVFSVEKANRVVATLTSGDGNETEITRTYQKPYTGNKGSSWRKKDRAIYRLDCATRQAALMHLSITAKREKTVFSTDTPRWLPATGPELHGAFLRICQVEIPKTPVIHPDQWLPDTTDTTISTTHPNNMPLSPIRSDNRIRSFSLTCVQGKYPHEKSQHV